MRSKIYFALPLLLLSAICINSQTKTDLQKAIDTARNGSTIYLSEGVYEASPSEYIEELCGNCPEHINTVYGTKGFIVKNKSLNIIGENKDKVIIITNAGYGIIFINSIGSRIEGVTISGGIRDTSGNATNAGIVLKYSKVTVTDCILSSDTVRSFKLPVVGISGVIVREGSEAFIINNRIINNTWDGIALYRGGKAFISDNIIQNGRGAGIGITWDASAIILRNRISGFWKGIGTFGTSSAVVKNNCIFDNLGWGLVISGNSFMLAENNVITRNGNCGVAPWADTNETASGIITNNIISENGWRKEWVCPQVGYWMNANRDKFIFTYNDLWDNTGGNYRDIDNLTNLDGNISVNPQFRDIFDFSLQPSSPLLNSGNPEITNLDGSRSHIGIDGGQSSK